MVTTPSAIYCQVILESIAALWHSLFPVQAVGAKPGLHSVHQYLSSLLWATSMINTACKPPERKSFISCLGLNILGQNTGKSALPRSVYENPVGTCGSSFLAEVWATACWWDTTCAGERHRRLGLFTALEHTLQFLKLYRVHRKSNYGKLLKKAAFANPPYIWQWHKPNYLAQS